MADSLKFNYEQAFSRNIGWVTNHEQQTLKNKTIAIAGMGGVGGSHLLTLTRLGIGNFHISDFDIFELANFNRQAGAYISTINQPKAETLAKFAKDINPDLNITIFEKGINEANVQQFLNGADLYLDGLDFFAVNARRLMFNECTNLSIPAVTAAPLGMGAAVLNFLPNKMTFEEYFCMEGHSEQEQLLRFLVGLSPAMLQRPYLADKSTVDFIRHKGPSTSMACEICAGIAATQVLKILLNRGKVICAPRGLHFDAYRNKLIKTWRPGGNRNPLQRFTIFIARKIIGTNQNSMKKNHALKNKPSLNKYNLIEKLLEAGIRAPSGDNCQPWHFEVIDSSEIILTIAPDCAKNFFDVDFSATYISIGAVLKNIEVAANHFNAETKHSTVITNDNSSPIKIKILINPIKLDQKKLPDLYIPMLNRTVNRRPYFPQKLSKSMWNDLITSTDYKEVHVATYTHRAEIKQWVKAIKAADIIRWSHPSIHEELFDKIRLNKAEAEKMRTGLEIDRLGVGPGAKHIMKFLSSWPRMQIINKVKGAQLLAAQTAFLARSSSGLIGVWIDKDTPENWIKAGETIEQIWINTHHLGLAIQPLPVAAYLERKWTLKGSEDFELAHSSLMNTITNTLEEFKTNHNKSICTMLFRVGKAIPMKDTAIRKEIDDFIKS